MLCNTYFEFCTKLRLDGTTISRASFTDILGHLGAFLAPLPVESQEEIKGLVGKTILEASKATLEKHVRACLI